MMLTVNLKNESRQLREEITKKLINAGMVVGTNTLEKTFSVQGNAEQVRQAIKIIEILEKDY